MRVPLPAARTMAAALRSGMMGYELLRLEDGTSGPENATSTPELQAIAHLQKAREINTLKTAKL
ncbi:MAG TPA: hypothetical protein VGQ35_21885 [Dongiaceae bacterium]|nr:hypothetical protein [Dongiaceae bacterium]